MPDILPSSPISDVYRKQVTSGPLKIGFLGLGTMGSAIVGNLLKTGHEVTVWNRTMSKVMETLVLLLFMLADRAATEDLFSRNKPVFSPLALLPL